MLFAAYTWRIFSLAREEYLRENHHFPLNKFSIILFERTAHFDTIISFTEINSFSSLISLAAIKYGGEEERKMTHPIRRTVSCF